MKLLTDALIHNTIHDTKNIYKYQPSTEIFINTWITNLTTTAHCLRKWVSERAAISYKLHLADKGLSFEVLDNGFQDLI